MGDSEGGRRTKGGALVFLRGVGKEKQKDDEHTKSEKESSPFVSIALSDLLQGFVFLCVYSSGPELCAKRPEEEESDIYPKNSKKNEDGRNKKEKSITKRTLSLSSF
jgi:hypothetical protein